MSTIVERDEGAKPPAIQVIVLGAGGGPQEHNVTALLIRSLGTGWAKGSVVALDAGVHLSSITKILEDTQPPGLGTSVALPHTLETGPFSGMEITSASAATNAGNITKHLIDTYLITHPHLDHISGFVINTAGLPGTRPKRLAGLPSTISAFKQHIFNNVIWPNLSDENNGAGLVTYMRLVEGGSPAFGEGDGKGYLEVTDGLGVRIFSVSHGHCIERHVHRGSTASSRYGSFDAPSIAASPRTIPGSTAVTGAPSLLKASAPTSQERESVCVYDSSAYFIRDNATRREILVFGDVEPDIVSLSPRNLIIWQEAAIRIATGNLVAIFIECSYDNSQTDDRLFGHLSPRYVIQEMQALASAVEIARRAYKPDPTKKRKREASVVNNHGTEIAIAINGDDRPVSPKSTRPAKKAPMPLTNAEQGGVDTPHLATPTAEMSLRDFESKTICTLRAPQFANALRGLKVVIIHVKERLVDGDEPRDLILRQLLEAEEEARLGCEFVVSSTGQSFFF
ncbi:cAMP phosphodiesterase class-II [Xylaria intraflava]|nr:cAMP phosphodiesterase class-II [Xylaria intraflava]